MSNNWAEITDVQKADGGPLPEGDSHREYIGLRGQFQTNSMDPDRRGRLCFFFEHTADGQKYEIRSSKGKIAEHSSTLLVYQTAHARYFLTLL